jgi:hypothetical protein
LAPRYFLSSVSASSLHSANGWAPTIILTSLTLLPSLTPSSRVGVPVIPSYLAYGDAAPDPFGVLAALEAFLEGFDPESDGLGVLRQLQYRVDRPHPAALLQELFDLCDIPADGLLVLFEGLDIWNGPRCRVLDTRAS